jgi:hypothetical protein
VNARKRTARESLSTLCNVIPRLKSRKARKTWLLGISWKLQVNMQRG